MISYPCPITKGQPTRMFKASFQAMCAASLAEEHPACKECRGKQIPAELEFIPEKEKSAVAKKSGKCEQCGKTEVAKLIKIHGKQCCSTCSVLRSAANNHPGILRDLAAEFRRPGEGEEKAHGKKSTFDAEAELISVCHALGFQDSDLDNAATLAKQLASRHVALDNLYREAQEEIKELHAAMGTNKKGQHPQRTGMALAIEQACVKVRDFLLDKNESYGNSAADPVRIFSQADPLEQINVRIDDKLSRMIRGGSYPGDNDEQDLLGYLMLKQAVRLYHDERARMAA